MSKRAKQRLQNLQNHLKMNPTSSKKPNLSTFNTLPSHQLQTILLNICQSPLWVASVIQNRPYSNLPILIDFATQSWYNLGQQAWTEAYAGHGTLGVKTAEQKEAMTAAPDTILNQIALANEKYETVHQHKCITFAAGKSSERLLQEIKARIHLSTTEEMRRCAEQTMLITALRLCRYLYENENQPSEQDIKIVSPLTTHVLDTSTGKPAENVTIQMERHIEETNQWIPVATGSTNSDGRVTDLLPGFYDKERLWLKGIYRLTFDIKNYYKQTNTKCFYPDCVISFYVDDPTQHYHVPLLLNPYGYSTYRGS